MERDKTRYLEIIDLLKNSEQTKLASKPGFCRVWAREAILILINKYPDIKIEAREVEIYEDYSHTFLRLTLSDSEPILCDGVGANKNPPFFGFEKDAPEYLRNSKIDQFFTVSSNLT